MFSEDHLNGLGGKHKGISQIEAVRFGHPWPRTASDRQKIFEEWHDIAMQVLHANRASFRLMAIYWRLISWETGEIWETDAELTSFAGRCDKKTISREIAMLRKLGLIIIDHEWVDRIGNGKKVRCRILRLAVPKKLPSGIVLR